MNTVVAGILKPSHVATTLIVALGITFLVWYVTFLWRKRHHYYHSYKAPGPPFSLPIFGHALLFMSSPQDIPQRLDKISERYSKGGIYTLWQGPKLTYVVSDVKYLQTILSHPGALNKDSTYRFFRPAVGESLFSAQSLLVWKTHRKLISPSFSQRILHDFFEIFVKQAEIFCNEVAVECDKGIFPLQHYAERCTFDVIMESAMGVIPHAQTINKDHEFLRLVQRGFPMLMARLFNVFYYPDIIFYNTSSGRFLKKSFGELRGVVTKVVQERKQVFERSLNGSKHQISEDAQKTRAPFLDSLLDTIYQEKEYWTDEELIDETTLFMIAGFDTTGTGISSVLMALGMFPDVQEKFHKEVVEQVGMHRSLIYTDLAELKYCQRVIKESLRLFESVFIARYVTEDIDLGDYIIPRGATVFGDLRRSARNPKYWKDPLKFDPDRFLPENMDDPAKLMVFSHGPRNCLGQRYAMLELTTVVATFIRKYKLHCAYKTVEEITMRLNGILKPLHGFKTSIELRHY